MTCLPRNAAGAARLGAAALAAILLVGACGLLPNRSESSGQNSEPTTTQSSTEATPAETSPAPPTTSTPPPAPTYPTDHTAYVRAFVDAWRAGNTSRMNALATDQALTMTNLAAQPVPIATYQTCVEIADPDGPFVHVFGGAVENWAFKVVTASLGGPDAIVSSHVGFPVPPTCT